MTRPAPAVIVAGACAAVLAFLGLHGFAWSDYDDEAARPLLALVGGDLLTFVETAPAYGGSLLIRAPFALLPSIWGGGELAVFRLMALPCLAAAMVLGLVLARLGTGRWPLLIVALAAGNPVTLRALEIGHPEELLGAALCVLAVIAALRDRPWAAGVLLGLAMANKAWAVLALGPVLLALQDRRWAAGGLALAIAGACTAPFVLLGAHGVAGAGTTNTIFQPWQVWWPLGDLGSVVRGVDGLVKPGYRTPPGWLSPVSHPLIAVLWLPLALAWRARRGGRHVDLLLLLALLFALRCVLDPWNTVYYHLPWLLALLAWEALARERPPVLTLAATVLVWVTFVALPGRIGPDLQSAAYLAWALPATAWMGAVALGARAPRIRRAAVPVTA